LLLLGLALFAGILFALHPIHTEAVANVVGRAEMLATSLISNTIFILMLCLASFTVMHTEGTHTIFGSIPVVGVFQLPKACRK
jgi:hypothetical protein